MAVRDLTQQFIKYRNKINFYSESSAEWASLSRFRLTPPKYILQVEKIKKDMDKLEKDIEELKNKCEKTKLVRSFDNQNKQDQQDAEQIDNDSSQILNVIGQIRNDIYDIFPEQWKTSTDLPPGETQQSLDMRKNSQLTLSERLQRLTHVFQRQQVAYIKGIQKQSNKGHHSSSPSPSNTPNEAQLRFTHSSLFNIDELDLDEDFDNYISNQRFTIQQQAQVDGNQQFVQWRLKQLRSINMQIQHIAIMFQDMHTLVVEQGTLLDNVEHNIIEARQNVRTGVAELVQV
ncbi:MAG: hypothetical protein EZS28_002641 [Streblomastix strix]|uniref:t-SNARE coiled-coil homology domain-containing protein n=1 Tax=Streblomastix strix TaxID=222440 RepID=A0A5J4X4D0_9EUKA|nr:MAG: hypothetical protein EZS28_002641 [Streblomastix strix]